MAKTIGIDLGTTNSVVSVLEGGQPTVIHNSEGRNTTPSVVAVTKDGEWVVGEIAKNQIITNPNTVASIKRYMGRDHSVKLNGKKYSPQEISAKILMKLKADAEAYLGERITEAVITVPAYFEDAQRQATKDAGKIAGLEVKRIINEPTAAALAYGFDKKDKEQTIMVYDLGGGTFDVSILQIGDGVFEVKATAGNNFLGGDDFDEALMHYIAKEFKKEQGIDLMGDPQAKQRLRVSAEKAKIELSAKNTTQINLPFITADASGPKHLDIEISRSKFEELIFDIVQKTVEPTKQAMSDANVRQEDIDQVILVGGSTRVPMVADIVQQITGKAPNKSVNPDEVVAIGAAIQAGVLAGELKGESGGIVLLDVTPLSLGVETLGGVFTKMINRNTTIPTQKKEVYSTAADGQTSVEIHVLQGEREMAAYNKTLGKFHLTDIPPAPRGIPQIEVSFDIDANGILQVNAKDLATQRQQTITITASTNLSKNDVERMVREAEAHAEEDKKRREEAEIHNNAETLIYRTEKNLKDFGDKIPDTEKKDVEEKLEATKQAVQSQDLNRIKSTTDDLLQATFKMSEHMYKDVGQTQQQAHEQAYAGVDPIETPHSNEPSPNEQVANGKVVDADFDEVK